MMYAPKRRRVCNMRTIRYEKRIDFVSTIRTGPTRKGNGFPFLQSEDCKPSIFSSRSDVQRFPTLVESAWSEAKKKMKMKMTKKINEKVNKKVNEKMENETR